VIYIVMGLLALNVVLGKSAASIDPQTAIATIGRQPGGDFLLWVILVGLVAYALWGVIRAVFDPFHKGNDRQGSLARAGYFLSAVGYAILALLTYNLIRGAQGAPQSGMQTQQFLAMLLSKGWGVALVGLIGLAVILAGLYEIKQGFEASFDKPFAARSMTRQEMRTAIALGQYGYIARGIVIALIGGLDFLAAYRSNASQPVGVNAALVSLLHQPYGVWVLAIIALGFIAFGLYSLMSSVWFRLK
jgi:hypothetical protein